MRKMTIALTALTLMLAVGLSAGCQVFHIVSGSGNTIDKTYDFRDFTAISAGWTFNVTVTHGAAYSVKVTMDDNLETYLDISQDGGTLKLGMDNGYIYHNTHLKAVVSTPRLTRLTLSGASNGNASGFSSADDFILHVSGASQATFNNMTVNKLSMEISGASRASGSVNAGGNAVLQASGASSIELSGKAVDADIESSGASTVNLSDFLVRDARVNVSGASNATVHASGTLSGDVSGASRLYYVGSPALGKIDTSGASSVSRK